jgi:hypothetical protein
LSLFSIALGAVLLGIVCVPGIFVLMVVYNRIYNKYRNPSIADKAAAAASKPKTPKVVIAAVAVISAIILVVFGALFYNGEKDPVISILDDSIQIKSMYGLTIDCETLLFVQSKSSPTIRIKRSGKRDVYVSFLNSESTERLFRDLMDAVPLNSHNSKKEY